LLLDLLQRHQTGDFNAIATADEPWFRYVYLTGVMYDRSWSDVTPCVRSGIGTSKVMIIVLTATPLLVLEARLNGRKSNQDYFLE
jgi:hypothetical protein